MRGDPDDLGTAAVAAFLAPAGVLCAGCGTMQARSCRRAWQAPAAAVW